MQHQLQMVVVVIRQDVCCLCDRACALCSNRSNSNIKTYNITLLQNFNNCARHALLHVVSVMMSVVCDRACRAQLVVECLE